MGVKSRLKAVFGSSKDQKLAHVSREVREVLLLNVDSSCLVSMHKPAFTWILHREECRICSTSGLLRNAFWMDLVDEKFIIFTVLE
jgi:hypothetical protein